MKVLALDLAKVTGWAMCDGTLRIAGVLDLSKVGERDGVYVGFSRWLVRTLAKRKPDVIVYEDPRFNRGFTYVPGFTALLTVEAAKWEIPCFPATVQEIKRFATGKGNAPKEAMRDAALQEGLLEWVPDEENAIDAAWVLEWFLATAETPEAA